MLLRPVWCSCGSDCWDPSTVKRIAAVDQRSSDSGDERTTVDHRRLIFLNVELKWAQPTWTAEYEKRETCCGDVFEYLRCSEGGPRSPSSLQWATAPGRPLTRRDDDVFMLMSVLCWWYWVMCAIWTVRWRWTSLLLQEELGAVRSRRCFICHQDGEVPLEGPPAGAPAAHARDPTVDPTSDNHAQHPSSGQWICRSRCHVATTRHAPGPRCILRGEYYQRLRHHQKSRWRTRPSRRKRDRASVWRRAKARKAAEGHRKKSKRRCGDDDVKDAVKQLTEEIRRDRADRSHGVGQVRCRVTVKMLTVTTRVPTWHLAPGTWIIVGVLCSRDLAIVSRSGVVGVNPEGVLEVEDAEVRDTVRGDKKLEDNGGELELWWCVWTVQTFLSLGLNLEDSHVPAEVDQTGWSQGQYWHYFVKLWL